MDQQLFEKDNFLDNLFNAIPASIFIVDKDWVVFYLNSEASKIFDLVRKQVLRLPGGEVLGCMNLVAVPGKCGMSVKCKSCVIRNSVYETIVDGKVNRKKAEMEFQQKDKTNTINMLVTTSPFKYDGQDYAILTLQDITELTKLEIGLKKKSMELNASLEELEVKNRLLEDDLHIAHKMQLSIVPQEEKVASLSRSFSLEIASVYKPCSKLGGDFWDIMELSENKIGIVVIDFAGHGIAPSLNTFRIKEFMYSSATEATSPAMVMDKMNKNIFKNFNMHGTCFYAVYDKQDKKLIYCRAGHPYGLWYKKSEDKLIELNSKGMALGLFPDSKYEEAVITFGQGDKIIFYTDGIIEATNKENDIFGEKRLHDIILRCKDKSSSAISVAIMEFFTDFTGGAELNDDITLIALGQKEN